MKPRPRSRHEAPSTDLARPAGANNRTRHPVRRSAPIGFALILWAAATGGCSLAVPVSGLDSDATPTGSIDRTAAFLPPSLDREDLRRAEAAMAVALDPQGNGGRSGWQNPQTGARGAFTAAGPPFADHDRVCRRFSGEVAPAGAPERRLSGSACREAGNTWRLTSEPKGQV